MFSKFSNFVKGSRKSDVRLPMQTICYQETVTRSKKRRSDDSGGSMAGKRIRFSESEESSPVSKLKWVFVEGVFPEDNSTDNLPKSLSNSASSESSRLQPQSPQQPTYQTHTFENSVNPCQPIPSMSEGTFARSYIPSSTSPQVELPFQLEQFPGVSKPQNLLSVEQLVPNTSSFRVEQFQSQHNTIQPFEVIPEATQMTSGNNSNCLLQPSQTCISWVPESDEDLAQGNFYSSVTSCSESEFSDSLWTGSEGRENWSSPEENREFSSFFESSAHTEQPADKNVVPTVEEVDPVFQQLYQFLLQ